MNFSSLVASTTKMHRTIFEFVFPVRSSVPSIHCPLWKFEEPNTHTFLAKYLNDCLAARQQIVLPLLLLLLPSRQILVCVFAETLLAENLNFYGILLAAAAASPLLALFHLFAFHCSFGRNI